MDRRVPWHNLRFMCWSIHDLSSWLKSFKMNTCLCQSLSLLVFWQSLGQKNKFSVALQYVWLVRHVICQSYENVCTNAPLSKMLALLCQGRKMNLRGWHLKFKFVNTFCEQFWHVWYSWSNMPCPLDQFILSPSSNSSYLLIENSKETIGGLPIKVFSNLSLQFYSHPHVTLQAKVTGFISMLLLSLVKNYLAYLPLIELPAAL